MIELRSQSHRDSIGRPPPAVNDPGSAAPDGPPGARVQQDTAGHRGAYPAPRTCIRPTIMIAAKPVATAI